MPKADTMINAKANKKYKDTLEAFAWLYDWNASSVVRHSIRKYTGIGLTEYSVKDPVVTVTEPMVAILKEILRNGGSHAANLQGKLDQLHISMDDLDDLAQFNSTMRGGSRT